MENLPLEILEVIFHHFSSLTDVQNCYKTCVRWRNLIAKMFRDKRNVLVACGCMVDDLDLEILDLIDTKMNYNDVFKDWNIQRGFLGPTCGILKNKKQEERFVICGGKSPYYKNDFYDYNYSTCIVLESPTKQFCKSFDLLADRAIISSVQLNENTLWVTGGCGRLREIDWRTIREQKSTEFISLDEPPVKGPDLPLTIIGHSIVKVDAKTIYIIGGKCMYKENVFMKDTWICDPTNNFKFKKGPCMNMARYQGISCAKMKIDNKNFLVAVHHEPNNPGYLPRYSVEEVPLHEKPIDSVELLDTSNPEKGWIIGPKLPYNMSLISMVSSPTGRGVIIIGGIAGRIPSNIKANAKSGRSLIELSGDSVESLKWTFLEQKLRRYRVDHTSLIISEQFTNELIGKKNAIKRKLKESID